MDDEAKLHPGTGILRLKNGSKMVPSKEHLLNSLLRVVGTLAGVGSECLEHRLG